MSTPNPTGGIIQGDDGPELLIRRRFDQPVQEVWAYLTDPALLARWYGIWTGDPAEGNVQLTMIEAPEEPGECRTSRCEPPTRLSVILTDPNGQDWELDIRLEEGTPGTLLRFRQPLGDFITSAGDIGPGWEYYLDRLTAVLHRRSAEEIDFGWHHPAQVEHYRVMDTGGGGD